jgi:hypothetical protein
MTYGLDQQLFVENGPTITAARAKAARTAYRAWRKLGPDGRLALVQRKLKPANDLIDGYPLAL